MPGHTVLGGPPLVRLLARLANLEVRGSAQPLPERLSEWLRWSDAIALAAALKSGKRTVVPNEAMLSCDAVRAELTQAIQEDELLLVRPPHKGRLQARRRVAPNDDPDYAVYRQCYLALQQRMEIAVAALREHLRSRLAQGSVGMARLASVDAVMEQALMEKEYVVLASIPSRLELRFAQLRESAQATDVNEDNRGSPGVKVWLDVFRQDMQRVLLAELDVRMLPAEGLQSALCE